MHYGRDLLQTLPASDKLVALPSNQCYLGTERIMKHL